MMNSVAAGLLVGGATAWDVTSQRVGQVHEHIADSNCKANYILKGKGACVKDGQCYPSGTEEKYACEDVDIWQWQHPTHPDPWRRFHAPGVNPIPTHRVTANGDAIEKVIWAYTGDITEGEAQNAYNPEGQPTVDMVLNTPINHITIMANVNVEKPTEWFVPGQNNTEGCGQRQTNKLPFGFDSDKKDQSDFIANLKKMHDAQITITLTLASWCTQLPVSVHEEWTPSMFTEFVGYYEKLRKDSFGGYLDGIDFDWEGFCKQTCLKGHNDCHCGWDDKQCGDRSPEELADGVTFTDGDGKNTMCWIMPTKSTMQVMTGITKAMKDAGHTVTLVPMSTSMYSGEPDTTPKQYLRNEYVKYRMQPYDGGSPLVEGSNAKYNLLEMADGVMLQWYSGYDAALCAHSDDPMACACNNEPADDYPNWITTNGTHPSLISMFYDTPKGGGNMFPTQFPVRCQACGKNVRKPDGTMGHVPCVPEDEEWFEPNMKDVNGSAVEPQSTIDEHNEKLMAYSKSHDDGVPYWWPKGYEVSSKCPRGIDCPDWRYKGEQPYSRQLKLLKSLSKVIDLNKVSIGFETLGTSIQVQMKSYADKALPYTDVAPDQKWKGGAYWKQCETNLTKESIAAGALSKEPLARCAEPLAAQQWGLQLNASEMVGLQAAVKAATGKDLAGVGVYTLAGILAVDPSKSATDEFNGMCRTWYPAIRDLNKHYKLAPRCGSNCWDESKRCPPSHHPGPAPAGKKWFCDYASKTCKEASGAPYDTKEDCEMDCGKPKPSPTPGPAPGPAPGPSPSPGHHACKDCFAGSSGVCKDVKDGACFGLVGGQCPGGTKAC